MRTSTKSIIVVLAALAAVALLVFSPFTEGTEAEVSVATVAPATTTTTTDPGPTQAEIEKLNTAIWVGTTNERIWNDELARQEAERQAEAARQAELDRQAEAARQEAAQRATTTAPAPASVPAAEQGTGRCGGDLPPCYVMMRESGGDIRAQNPSSSASGKWQFIRGTWAGFGGYSEAYLAPESVQDAKARQLWAGGAGCGHWSACG